VFDRGPDQEGIVTLLDCSSFDTALHSLSELLGSPADALKRELTEAEIDWGNTELSSEEQLIHLLGFESRDSLPAPDRIRWFHATRAPKGSAFAEGILPTGEALPKLFDLLGEIAGQWSAPEEWERFKDSIQTGSSQYAVQLRRKRGDKNAWGGPFAFLVRDAALGHVGDHQMFWDVPETVKDLCATYEEQFGHSLLEAYQAGTQPCLVNFIRPGNWPGAVFAALNYAHRQATGLDHSFRCNQNFASDNKTIPAEWIDRIEWLHS
jgi:hypothetical protein